MISFEQMQIDYAKSYVDSTRIYFIEKYLSTFNASARTNNSFYAFPKTESFFKKYI